MVSPVVKNGLLHQSKGVIRARRRGYDPGSPGKIQFGDNFGIWDRVTAGRTVTCRERRERIHPGTLSREKKEMVLRNEGV